MARTANSVLTRAARTLVDTGAVRWSTAELLDYLNDARRELSIFRPDVYAATVVVNLVGGTRQTIPDTASRFLNANRNIADDGATPGRAVRLVQREDLDADAPGWHTDPATTTVREFMFDDGDPRTFWCSPPATGGIKLEIVVAVTPTDISNAANELSAAEDAYVTALHDYVVFRALAIDSEQQGNAAKASAFRALWDATTGQGDARDATASPNTRRTDGVPPRGG